MKQGMIQRRSMLVSVMSAFVMLVWCSALSGCRPNRPVSAPVSKTATAPATVTEPGTVTAPPTQTVPSDTGSLSDVDRALYLLDALKKALADKKVAMLESLAPKGQGIWFWSEPGSVPQPVLRVPPHESVPPEPAGLYDGYEADLSEALALLLPITELDRGEPADNTVHFASLNTTGRAAAELSALVRRVSTEDRLPPSDTPVVMDFHGLTPDSEVRVYFIRVADRVALSHVICIPRSNGFYATMESEPMLASIHVRPIRLTTPIPGKVELHVTVTNLTSKPLYFDSDFLNTGYRIKGPDGAVIEEIPVFDRLLKPMGKAAFWHIEPGKTHTYKADIELCDRRQSNRHEPGIEALAFHVHRTAGASLYKIATVPGTYTIELVWQAAESSKSRGEKYGFENVFVGELVSNKIQLKVLKHQTGETNGKEKSP